MFTINDIHAIMSNGEIRPFLGQIALKPSILVTLETDHSAILGTYA